MKLLHTTAHITNPVGWSSFAAFLFDPLACCRLRDIAVGAVALPDILCPLKENRRPLNVRHHAAFSYLQQPLHRYLSARLRH